MTDTGIDAAGDNSNSLSQMQSRAQSLTPGVLGVYGFMALPLALVGYPVAIWLPAFYAGHVGLPLAAVATPEIIPPPPMGTMIMSSSAPISLAWLEMARGVLDRAL